MSLTKLSQSIYSFISAYIVFKKILVNKKLLHLKFKSLTLEFKVSKNL